MTVRDRQRVERQRARALAFEERQRPVLRLVPMHALGPKRSRRVLGTGRLLLALVAAAVAVTALEYLVRLVLEGRS